MLTYIVLSSNASIQTIKIKFFSDENTKLISNCFKRIFDFLSIYLGLAMDLHSHKEDKKSYLTLHLNWKHKLLNLNGNNNELSTKYPKYF